MRCDGSRTGWGWKKEAAGVSCGATFRTQGGFRRRSAGGYAYYVAAALRTHPARAMHPSGVQACCVVRCKARLQWLPDSTDHGRGRLRRCRSSSPIIAFPGARVLSHSCAAPRQGSHYVPVPSAGKNLQAQYERWQPRAKYKMHLDPTMEDVKKLCVSCRRTAKVGYLVVRAK